MEKQYYISREQFITLKEEWKKIIHPTAADMIIYNILRNKPADNGFVPKTKNIQGNNAWGGFDQALSNARYFCSERRKFDYAKRVWIIDDETAKQSFIARFGIERPAGMIEKLNTKHRELNDE